MRKKALITGASRGIGRGVALKLAQSKYDIAITYNSKLDEAKSLAEEVEKLGGKCFYYQASMQNADVPEKVTKQAIEDLGGIDLLVCNAGLTRHTSLLDVNADFIDFVYGLNYRSYILCSKVAANYMVENNVKGSIIFISSTRGIRAYENDSIYGSFKAALNRAVESFAIEMGQYGIRINSIAPGATAIRGSYNMETLKNNHIATIVPLKRRGKPEDIANMVNFLTSDEATYITGDTIKIDGGLILYGPSESPPKKG